MSRPDNFEFAMDFVGSEEEASVRAYVERLEQQRAMLLSALQGLLNALPSATTHPAIKDARAAIAAVEQTKEGDAA